MFHYQMTALIDSFAYNRYDKVDKVYFTIGTNPVFNMTCCFGSQLSVFPHSAFITST